MAVTEALCMKTAWGSCCTGLPVPKPCLCVHTSGSWAQGLPTPRSNLHTEKEHESWAIALWVWGRREGDDLLLMRVRFLFRILTAYVTRLGGSENDFSAGKKKKGWSCWTVAKRTSWNSSDSAQHRFRFLTESSGNWLDFELSLNATLWLPASEKPRVTAQQLSINAVGAVGLRFSHAEPILVWWYHCCILLIETVVRNTDTNLIIILLFLSAYGAVWRSLRWLWSPALIFTHRCILEFGNWDKNSLLMIKKKNKHKQQSYQCVH